MNPLSPAAGGGAPSPSSAASPTVVASVLTWKARTAERRRLERLQRYLGTVEDGDELCMSPTYPVNMGDLARKAALIPDRAHYFCFVHPSRHVLLEKLLRPLPHLLAPRAASRPAASPNGRGGAPGGLGAPESELAQTGKRHGSRIGAEPDEAAPGSWTERQLMRLRDGAPRSADPAGGGDAAAQGRAAVGAPVARAWGASSDGVEAATDWGAAMDAVSGLLTFGGFAYFDIDDEIVAVTAVTPRRSRNMLQFGPPKLLPPECVARLEALGRWQPATLAHWRRRGARHMAWITPGEKLGGRFFGRYGGFAFLFGRRPSEGSEGGGGSACAPVVHLDKATGRQAHLYFPVISG
jgi:hypothetical protein